MKDYNTKMAIGISENEDVSMVHMGECIILDDTKKEHLLTYGLGPCVGVSIVIKNHDQKVFRLLAHFDMGQLIGVSFRSLQCDFRRMKNIVGTDIDNIEISLTSTDSYRNIESLGDMEIKLLAIILNEFQEFGVTVDNIKFNHSSQVQISPDGVISTYREEDIRHNMDNMMEESLNEYGGRVEDNLNIYVTKMGAYMGNCSLRVECSEEEKEQLLNEKYWNDYLKKGYKLKVGPSFNDPSCMAVYVENWQDQSIQQYGTVPGCIQASMNRKL